VIPGAGLDRGDVRYSYSGVRPLPHVDEGAESAITRRHIVHDHAPEIHGLISIVGGKLTTYRNLAEQATDHAMRKLGRPDPGSITAGIPLPGGNVADFPGFVAGLQASSGLDAATIARLTSIYGVQTGSLLERARRNPELLEPIPGAPATIRAEIPFAFDFEAAQTLTDVIMRRTMLGLNVDHALPALEPIVNLAAEHNAWDGTRTLHEVTSFMTYLERFRSQAITAAQ
jgi:glycerol-3-phosphate dehydrogenase